MTPKPLPYQLRGALYLAGRPFALLADDMGLGKGLPVDARVLTPHGWTVMGALRVGDKVIGSNGRACTVTGVYPQGVRPCYSVTFQDGCSVVCDDQHLWKVTDRNGDASVVDTAAMYRRGARYRGGTNKWHIPTVSPVQFDAAQLPLHPYVLGALIGDGCLVGGCARLSVPPSKTDIGNRVAALLPYGHSVTVSHINTSSPQWHITRSDKCRAKGANAVTAAICSLGLSVKSPLRFIPEVYKFAAVEQRLELLRGLMDTDGSAQRNRVTFHTVSATLAADVAELVQSLGGSAVIRSYDRTRESKPVEYQVNVRLAWACPFHLPRKAAHWAPGRFDRSKRFISSVEPVSARETVCIRVDAPDSLFVVDHYVVTHNTAQVVIAADLCEARRITVLCPGLMRGTWPREFELWSGMRRSVHVVWSAKDTAPIAGADVVVCNWENAIRPGMYEALMAREPAVLVLDEAHELKDRRAKRTIAVFGRHANMRSCLAASARRTWALTGTPMPNTPDELWTLLRLQGLETSYGDFRDRFCVTKHNPHAPKSPTIMPGVRDADALAALLRRNSLRRVEDDVAGQLADADQALPPLTVDTLEIDGEPEPDLSDALDRAGDALRHALDTGDWSAVEQTPHVATARRLLGKAKAREAAALASREGGKVVLFAWHRETIAELRSLLGDAAVVLTGGMTGEAKQTAVDRFQRDAKAHYCIAQVQVANAGVTLTAANAVYVVEPSWVPAHNKQAVKRLHRIGQTRPVRAYYLAVRGTIDARIMSALAAKSRAISAVLR